MILFIPRIYEKLYKNIKILLISQNVHLIYQFIDVQHRRMLMKTRNSCSWPFASLVQNFWSTALLLKDSWQIALCQTPWVVSLQSFDSWDK
ncbi:hypothetical protein X975_18806, partial [Stegodyphus mimosarum]